MHYKKYWIAVSLLASLGSGCATSPTTVQTVTEFADVPLQFHTVLAVPSVPAPDKNGDISVAQALKSASELRTYGCYLHSRYRELLRFATFGNVVMARTDESQCPEI